MGETPRKTNAELTASTFTSSVSNPCGTSGGEPRDPQPSTVNTSLVSGVVSFTEELLTERGRVLKKICRYVEK